MNLCDCYVTMVLGAPYEMYSRWWVNVEYNSCGRLAGTAIMCSSEEEAAKVDVGFHFLA